MEYWYDEAAAERAVTFFRKFLRHAKGALAGKPFELADWQADQIIRPLFGYKRPDGTRKYRTVYVEVGRGAGKTTLAAGLALYLLLSDGEKGAEIYSAAVDASQARLCFDVAKSMVEAEPALRKRCKLYRNSIVVAATNSSYKVLSADARSKHGFNSHGIIFDEVAQQPNRDLYDALHTSLGKRAQPIEFLITTAGQYNPESIGWQLHDYAVQVRDGSIVDESFLPVLFSAGVDDDIQAESTWIKANPNYPLSPTRDYMVSESRKAVTLPSYTNTFLTLHLGIWTQQVTRWLSLHHWQACKATVPDLTGRDCYAGLDAATTTDISALALVFPATDTEPQYVLNYFWIPEGKIKASRDNVPYLTWSRDPSTNLTVTDGDVCDYDRIRADIVALGKKYNILELRYDPWNVSQLATQLSEGDGFTLTQHRQGFVSMNEPSKAFERAVVSRTIAHPNNPIMTWMLGNVSIKTDPAGNIKPDKSASRTGRIDGVVATIMAVGALIAQRNTTVTLEWL